MKTSATGRIFAELNDPLSPKLPVKNALSIWTWGKHVLAELFWMNNKAIIEFGFRRTWRILQISEGVIHRGRRRKKNRSLLLLARTQLGMKIYDMAFQWVCLSK